MNFSTSAISFSEYAGFTSWFYFAYFRKACGRKFC